MACNKFLHTTKIPIEHYSEDVLIAVKRDFMARLGMAVFDDYDIKLKTATLVSSYDSLELFNNFLVSMGAIDITVDHPNDYSTPRGLFRSWSLSFPDPDNVSIEIVIDVKKAVRLFNPTIMREKGHLQLLTQKGAAVQPYEWNIERTVSRELYSVKGRDIVIKNIIADWVAYASDHAHQRAVLVGMVKTSLFAASPGDILAKCNVTVYDSEQLSFMPLLLAAEGNELGNLLRLKDTDDVLIKIRIQY